MNAAVSSFTAILRRSRSARGRSSCSTRKYPRSKHQRLTKPSAHIRARLGLGTRKGRGDGADSGVANGSVMPRMVPVFAVGRHTSRYVARSTPRRTGEREPLAIPTAFFLRTALFANRSGNGSERRTKTGRQRKRETQQKRHQFV